MSARTETLALMATLARAGLNLSFEDANELRRAQITLHRWSEGECGDSGSFSSWAIERDEETKIPYRVVHPHKESRGPYRIRIADKEAGALRRVKALCQRVKAYYFHQTDPRGCALYVSREPLTDSNYSSHGVACCA